MANLHFHYGVMSSSKSASLLITAYNWHRKGKHVEIIKPAFDKRFGPDTVNSRIGLMAPATALPNLDGYNIGRDTNMLLVDEVQFFSPSDIDKLVHIADVDGRIVMCYGLMVDSNQEIFPASRRLIEVGAELHQMKTVCEMPECEETATHHLRFDGAGGVIRAGDQFALGDSNYKSVCRYHFNKIYHGICGREK